MKQTIDHQNEKPIECILLPFYLEIDISLKIAIQKHFSETDTLKLAIRNYEKHKLYCQVTNRILTELKSL